MVKNIIFDLSELIISGYHGTENVVARNTDLSSEEFLARKTEVKDFFLDISPYFAVRPCEGTD